MRAYVSILCWTNNSGSDITTQVCYAETAMTVSYWAHTIIPIRLDKRWRRLVPMHNIYLKSGKIPFFVRTLPNGDATHVYFGCDSLASGTNADTKCLVRFFVWLHKPKRAAGTPNTHKRPLSLLRVRLLSKFSFSVFYAIPNNYSVPNDF